MTETAADPLARAAPPGYLRRTTNDHSRGRAACARRSNVAGAHAVASAELGDFSHLSDTRTKTGKAAARPMASHKKRAFLQVHPQKERASRARSRSCSSSHFLRRPPCAWAKSRPRSRCCASPPASFRGFCLQTRPRCQRSSISLTTSRSSSSASCTSSAASCAPPWSSPRQRCARTRH